MSTGRNIDVEAVEWTRQGEAAVAAAIERLDDAALRAPSRLPDWSRGHVLTHLARNADALCNLLDWAGSGVEHPMYPDRATRTADIEAGAGRPAGEQRADLAAAGARLAGDIAALPDDHWPMMLRGATGRALPARDVPWLRTREVWLHLVDLDVGAGLDVLPAGVAARLCAENLAAYAKRDDVPPLVVTVHPDGAPTRLGGADDSAPSVEGTAADLVGWLTGRQSRAGTPDLPSWL